MIEKNLNNLKDLVNVNTSCAEIRLAKARQGTSSSAFEFDLKIPSRQGKAIERSVDQSTLRAESERQTIANDFPACSEFRSWPTSLQIAIFSNYKAHTFELKIRFPTGSGQHDQQWPEPERSLQREV